MNDLSYGFKIMNSLLLEATLKDSFSSIVEDAVIRVVLNDNSEKMFVVREVMAGRVKVVDRDTKVLYTFTDNAIKDGELILHKYDRTASNFEGEELKLDVKQFVIGKEGGDLNFVDMVDPELQKRADDMNSELKTAKKGDKIYISSEETRTKGNLTNTIILGVYNLEPEMLTCTLDDIDSEKSTNSVDRLAKVFRNSNIYIEIDDLVKLKNNNLELILKTDSTIIPIRNIIAIEVVGPNQVAGDDDESELAKQKLTDKIESSDEFKDAIAKKPNFWETLLNASPKGVNQLDDILTQTVMSNSYLTRGEYVNFKLVSDSKIVNSGAKLIKNTQIYDGKVEKNNVIKHGTRKRGHWELKIIEEIDPATFIAKIKYCNKSLRCQSQGKGTIKIVKNG